MAPVTVAKVPDIVAAAVTMVYWVPSSGSVPDVDKANVPPTVVCWPNDPTSPTFPFTTVRARVPPALWVNPSTSRKPWSSSTVPSLANVASCNVNTWPDGTVRVPSLTKAGIVWEACPPMAWITPLLTNVPGSTISPPVKIKVPLLPSPFGMDKWPPVVHVQRPTLGDRVRETGPLPWRRSSSCDPPAPGGRLGVKVTFTWPLAVRRTGAAAMVPPSTVNPPQTMVNVVFGAVLVLTVMTEPGSVTRSSPAVALHEAGPTVKPWLASTLSVP